MLVGFWYNIMKNKYTIVFKDPNGNYFTNQVENYTWGVAWDEIQREYGEGSYLITVIEGHHNIMFKE